MGAVGLGVAGGAGPGPLYGVWYLDALGWSGQGSGWPLLWAFQLSGHGSAKHAGSMQARQLACGFNEARPHMRLASYHPHIVACTHAGNKGTC